MAQYRLHHVEDPEDGRFLCPQGQEVLYLAATDPLDGEAICPVCEQLVHIQRPETFRAARKPDGFAIMLRGKCIDYAKVYMQFTADRIAHDLDEHAEAIPLPFYGDVRS